MEVPLLQTLNLGHKELLINERKKELLQKMKELDIYSPVCSVLAALCSTM